ncbi:MAG: CapA family protein [Chloroflexi bacterium]|nr:CapA family protein [Chloroflexota bacterium]
MHTEAVTFLATGDLILDEPEPDSFFEPSRKLLCAADFVVGHVEVPFTTRVRHAPLVPPEARDPAKLSALKAANVAAASLAANHIYDGGEGGIQDTLDGLKAQHIQAFGAGMNLDEARQPVIVTRGGLRFGLLSYNCVGPKTAWAGASKAGGAYVHVITHYELDHAEPGGRPLTYTGADAESLLAMVDDITRLREQCDVLSVSFHKGTVHTPVKVLAYEKQVAHAAIDAGADVVLSHHAHILRGIEVYKGKPIYHGLGNFVTVTQALSTRGVTDPGAWALRRKQLFGFEPDPNTPEYPFHPESRLTLLARITLDDNRQLDAGFVPCVINQRSQPEVVGHDERGTRVLDYVERISREAGLSSAFTWRGDEVAIAAA